MKTVLYLNGVQVELLKQQGFHLSALSLQKIKESLPWADYEETLKVTKLMCSAQGVLNKIGLLVDECGSEGFRFLTPTYGVFDTAISQLPPDITLSATMGVDDTLFIYPIERTNNNCNDMYKAARLNILGALATATTLKELIKFKLFNTTFMLEGIQYGSLK